MRSRRAARHPDDLQGEIIAHEGVIYADRLAVTLDYRPPSEVGWALYHPSRQ